MLADKVECNNCGEISIIERTSDTCPSCNSNGLLSDVEQDIEIEGVLK